MDWPTVASLATAGGTLVLAMATFASVRSANRVARTAERSLQVGIRPTLFPSRLEDPPVKIMWVDRHWTHVAGGRASVELGEGVIYLAVSLRNVGSGIAVLHSWYPFAKWDPTVAHEDPAQFRRLTRDEYVPAGDIGFWQGSLRDPSEPIFGEMAAAIERQEMLVIDLLYGDLEGGQRTISRFSLIPRGESEWLCSVGRHWNLDRPDPR